MRVIFFGTPQFALPTLERLLNHPHFNVIGVVTQPDKRRGRGKTLLPSAVKKVALSHQIPVWQPKRLKKSPETLEKLQQAQADVFVVIAYGQILPKSVLDMPKLGCINVHGSILPRYRGAAPIQWSLYQGETETGITTILMDEGMDTGDMLLKAYTPITLLDNADDIAFKLAHQGADLLIETLLQRETGILTPIPQDAALATYAPLIEKSDYIIDWNRPAIEIHHHVRGFYPNCVTTYQNQPLKILATVPLGDAYGSQFPSDYDSLQQQWESLTLPLGQPGEVVGIVKQWGAIVQTGKEYLLLKTVQLSGKRPQSGWDFVNGMRLSLGEEMG